MLPSNIQVRNLSCFPSCKTCSGPPPLDNDTIAATNSTGTSIHFPYVIEGCGLYTGLLANVLLRLGTVLAPALNDVGLGLDSKYGFRALFKDGSTSTYVRGILRSIASGQKLTGLQPDRFLPTAPRFACVAPSTTSQYEFLQFDAWSFCNSPDVGLAFYVGDTSYIFLCPNLWRVEVMPQRSTCPFVVHNQFLGSGQPLSMYLTYLLIHEMVHFYLGEASLGPYSVPPEVYPINNCVALGTLDSVHNPQNYQYYVASESSRSSCTLGARLIRLSGRTGMHQSPRSWSAPFLERRRKRSSTSTSSHRYCKIPTISC